MFLQTLKMGRVSPPEMLVTNYQTTPVRNAQRPDMYCHCRTHLKDRSNFLLQQADMLPDPEIQLDCEHKE